MEPTTNELHLFLGRVEGKLDSVLAAQSAFGERLAKMEWGHVKVAERLTTLETGSTLSKHWAALFISVISMVTVAADHLKGLFH